MSRIHGSQFSLVVMLAAACGSASPQPTSPPSGSASPGAANLRCEPRGNAVTTDTLSDDVPVIALYERDAWHSGFDVPSLLVWSDGTIDYSEGTYGKSLRLMQATTEPDKVRQLVAHLGQQLRAAPPDSELTRMTDQPTVQIILRDDQIWRVIDVYGLTPEVPTVPVALRDVVAAYRELLDLRPHTGVPAPTTSPRPPRWPDELPTYRGQMAIDQLALCALRRGR